MGLIVEMGRKNKKGLILGDYLGWILILVGVLVIILIGIGILTGKLGNWGDFIKNLFRFGR